LRVAAPIRRPELRVVAAVDGDRPVGALAVLFAGEQDELATRVELRVDRDVVHLRDGFGAQVDAVKLDLHLGGFWFFRLAFVLLARTLPFLLALVFPDSFVASATFILASFLLIFFLLFFLFFFLLFFLW